MGLKLKVNKIIITVTVFLIFILNLFLIAIVTTRKNKVDGPDMEYKPNIVLLEYYCGGNEYGQSKSIRLYDYEFEYKLDGGTVDITKEKKYNFLIDDYNALDNIVEKYNMKQWTNLEKSDLQVLDGSTTSLTIKFNDGLIIKLGDEYKMNSDGNLAIHEIVDLFESLIK